MVNTHQNSGRKLSLAASSALILIAVASTIFVFFLALRHLISMQLPLFILTFFACALVLGAILYCILINTEGSRTVKGIKLSKGMKETKTIIFYWFTKRGFKIEDRGNSIMAVKGLLGSSKIYFRLGLKEEDGTCSVRGEFYTKSWPSPELDLREKAWLGRMPRRRGFRLMNEFLEYLKIQQQK